MLKTGLTLAAATAGVLLPATAASAWTVGYEAGDPAQVQISAAAGETNDMGLTLMGESVRIIDSGGVSKAFAPCLKSGANGADCPWDEAGMGVSLSLGDKNDTAFLADGLGADTLVYIDGGPGHDRIGNGASPGLLVGAVGDDVFQPGRGTDTVLGQDGFDVVAYPERTEPVRVDLGGDAVSGEPGEGDALSGVEAVLGGTAGDELIGTDGNETFVPAKGRDRVEARGGVDEIDVRDGYVDTVDCGEGADTVTADQLDVLVGCETTDVAHVDPVEPPAPLPGPITVDPAPAPAPAPPAALPAPFVTPVPTAPVADRTRPTLRALKVTRLRGTATVRFTLSERARVALTVERCQTPKRCRKVKTIRRSGRRGANALRVAAGAGRLRVKLVATDAAGNRSTARSATLRVTRQ